VKRPVRAGVLALGLVGLLVIVALAARGEHSGGRPGASDRVVPASLQDALFTLIAIVYVVIIVGVVFALFRNRHDWHERKSHWMRNFVIVLAFFSILTFAGYRAMATGGLRERAQEAQRRQQEQGGTRERSGGLRIKPVRTRSAEFSWWVAGALGGLVLGYVVLLIVRRRPLSPRTGGLPVEEELAAVVAATIDDLRRERDARRAVIAAYANMERVLASHGLGRRPAEVPLEYLSRILRALRVRESAVQSLTRLFEYAKFSPHEIDAGMKEEAIAALLAVREDLQIEERAAA
jgi:uncharacterized protein DUF4129